VHPQVVPHLVQLTGLQELVLCTESGDFTTAKALAEVLPKLTCLTELGAEIRVPRTGVVWQLPPSVTDLSLPDSPRAPTVFASGLQTVLGVFQDEQLRILLDSNTALTRLELGFGRHALSEPTVLSLLQRTTLTALDLDDYVLPGDLIPRLPALKHLLSLDALLPTSTKPADVPSLLAALPLLEACWLHYVHPPQAAPVQPCDNAVVELPQLVLLATSLCDASLLRLRMPKLEGLYLDCRLLSLSDLLQLVQNSLQGVTAAVLRRCALRRRAWHTAAMPSAEADPVWALRLPTHACGAQDSLQFYDAA
jgi:hypothetical protein